MASPSALSVAASPQYFKTPLSIVSSRVAQRSRVDFPEPDGPIVISRAGANAICELLALKKPNLLIPLSANASRGDQILNANSFKKHGYSAVLMEEDITPETLLAAVRDLYQKRMTYVNNMALSEQNDAIGKIMELITANSK